MSDSGPQGREIKPCVGPHPGCGACLRFLLGPSPCAPLPHPKNQPNQTKLTFWHNHGKKVQHLEYQFIWNIIYSWITEALQIYMKGTLVKTVINNWLIKKLSQGLQTLMATRTKQVTEKTVKQSRRLMRVHAPYPK